MQNLSWQQKLILVAGSAFMLYAMGYIIYAALIKPQTEMEIVRINGAGADGIKGIIDPDLEKADDLLIAFSSLTDEMTGKITRSHLNVDLAFSSDQGKIWYHLARVFNGRYDEFIDSDGVRTFAEGTWRYEQPTIVYDPKDSKAPYKIFAYKYFWNAEKGAALARQSGVIVYKSATTLNPGNWSSEVALFSASASQPPAPYNQMVQLTLDRLNPSLKNYVAYADPSAIVTDRGLLMLLSAYSAQDLEKPEALIMIGSQDHGQSWVYVGTILTRGDLSSLQNYTSFNAPSLFEKNGNYYLMLSLGNETLQNDGAHVFAFDEIYKAQLKRDPAGVLTVINHIKPEGFIDETGFGIGQATYVDTVKGGVHMTQFRNNKYNLYQTQKSPLKDTE